MKLGVRAKLFVVSVGVIAVSFAAADAYLAANLDRELTNRIREDLFARLSLVERDASRLTASTEDLTAWDDLADEIGPSSGTRVTFIRRDGRVIGDSELDGKPLERIENHATRPEVADAFTRGRGESTRFSGTVRHRLMYVAMPLKRGGNVLGVARLARPLTEVDHALARVHNLVLLATAFALAIAVLMSTLAADWMSRSVRALTVAASRMAGGDLETRIRSTGNDEIAELGAALDRLADNLSGALTELKSERDLLGRVLQGMREGVLVLDEAGRIALANPALREMLLLDAGSVGKLPLEVIRNAELQELLERTSKTRRTQTCEIDLAGLKPRRLFVHSSLLDDGVLVVFVDVTDLRRLESVRRDFVANVSHELRTPIAAIRSAAETLQTGALGTADGPEFVQIIERHAERLQRLVEDLLELSRIESRQFHLQLEAVDLGGAVRHILGLLRELAEAKALDVRVEVPDNLCVARADRRALEQVLSNLVENAIKYCPRGARITVRAAAKDSSVEVVVEDTGPGIEARHLPRLFERFYRADPGRSRELGGTGLGLSIVKHLVEAMGGIVSVESTPGRGSAFSFTLPKAAA